VSTAAKPRATSAIIIFFQALDADALSRTLGTFALGEGTPQHLAIDGKTLRGSRRLDAKAVHGLSAFATALGAVIGEMGVKPDQNEIAAAVVLLERIPIKWTHLIDKDAAHNQTVFACRNRKSRATFLRTCTQGPAVRWRRQHRRRHLHPT
jgi:hypothetical protein